MIFGVIVLFAVGAMCVVLGIIIWKKQKIDLVHDPDMTGNRDLFTGRGRLDGRADLLRIAAHGEFLAVLKYRIKFIVIDHALTGKSCDQTAALRALNMILLDQMAEKDSVILLADPAKAR